MVWIAAPERAEAQTYSFSTVTVDGAERVDAETILSYAGIARGARLSAAELNDAYQRVLNSGLFETVEFLPRGGRLVIKVKEFPTINKVAIEGNKQLGDDKLLPFLRSVPRQVYSPSVAEADAAQIIEAYEASGRLAATVTPSIIRRSGNRVDLVFDVQEGRQVEIERLSFVGNRAFSDARLRRVLETKQAGTLRALVQRDNFDPARIPFDRQVLTDFYQNRGYVDFQILSVNSEFSRERNAYFLTFNIREGQSFKIGAVSTVSEIAEADEAEFAKAVKLQSGQVYSPARIEDSIARLERLAIQKGISFLAVEPRITRNDRDLTLDVEFALTRGPRIFVERIDIEGNATTLDRVVRQQFRVVEGDPFNPRQIRQAAERIRALGFFSSTDVTPTQGTAPDRVIVDVNVTEQPTGSFSFGANYSVSGGFGLVASFSEANFLGRGQAFSFNVNGGEEDLNASFNFTEPHFLGRDVAFNVFGGYSTTQYIYEHFETTRASLGTGLTFPVSDHGRLETFYSYTSNEMVDVDTDSAILQAEIAEGRRVSSAVGYRYSFDNRRSGLNPDAGTVFRFGQEFGGAGGDNRYIKTTATAAAERRIANGEVTLRATLDGGALTFLDGQNSRVVDRFRFGNTVMRGFEPGGVGPRDLGASTNDALGGNYYAVLRLESEFPLGLPEEYGLTGGLFIDTGSVWGLDNPGTVDDSFHLRSVAGFALFWTTPIGPLRFNFTKALKKEDYDVEQKFDLTISTRF